MSEHCTCQRVGFIEQSTNSDTTFVIINQQTQTQHSLITINRLRHNIPHQLDVIRVTTDAFDDYSINV